MDTHFLNNVAAAGYSCDAYGAGTYDSASSCTVEQTGSGTPGGDLAYTGESIVFVSGLALIVIVSSVIAIIKALRKSA